MSTTRLENIIDIDVFAKAMREDTMKLTNVFTSGIMANDETFAPAMNTSHTITVPIWLDLARGNGAKTASDDPSIKIIPDNVGMRKMVARRVARNEAWSSMRLTAEMGSGNPMDRIRERVSNWWETEFQETLVAILKGILRDNVLNDNGDMVFRIALPTATVGSVTDANKIGPSSFIDAGLTMGDARKRLKLAIMHPVVVARLEKADQIAFLKSADNDVSFKTYMGQYRIVESDEAIAIPVVQGGVTVRVEYVTVLCAEGAIKWNETPVQKPVEVESVPDAGNGSGEERLYTRRNWLMHPFGFTYTGMEDEAGEFPTNGEFEQASAWDRVASSRKHVPIAFLISNG